MAVFPRGHLTRGLFSITWIPVWPLSREIFRMPFSISSLNFIFVLSRLNFTFEGFLLMITFLSGLDELVSFLGETNNPLKLSRLRDIATKRHLELW